MHPVARPPSFFRSILSRRAMRLAVTVTIGSATISGCEPGPALDPDTDLVFYGAQVFDGAAEAMTDDPMVIQVSEGRIVSVEPMAEDDPVVADALSAAIEVVDATGKFILPGFINAHGHAGSAFGPTRGMPYDEYVESHLERYARYGVTTVNSLGGDRAESLPHRDASRREGGLDQARLMVAGEVVAAQSAEEAVRMVEANHAMGVDWIKGRVDDDLGTGTKMPMDAAKAAIDRAHELGYQTAFHLFYLEDAKQLLRAGVDLVAHSIRDQAVDDAVIQLFRETGKCYVPTLTREVSTFVYGERPDFFDDPFLMDDVDTSQVVEVSNPTRREEVAASVAAAAYRNALVVASENLKSLVDAGIPIAFGTDTGPLGRFQGYFEHMELSMMEAAGLTPVQVLQSATGTAAWCLGREDIGLIEAGRRADLMLLGADPTEAVGNTRSLEGVWVGGSFVPGSAKAS